MDLATKVIELNGSWVEARSTDVVTGGAGERLGGVGDCASACLEAEPLQPRHRLVGMAARRYAGSIEFPRW